MYRIVCHIPKSMKFHTLRLAYVVVANMHTALPSCLLISW
jgi:hypothetical protein